jgi:hypothetical protein
LVLGLFRRARDDLARSLQGVRREAVLDWRASASSNSAAWLAWHVARGQDRNLSELSGVRQLWVADGWADRFGRPADPGDTGFGHTADQAAAFRSPGAALLLAYHDVVHGLAERYLATAPPSDLARPVTSPTLGNTHTVEERLRGLLVDTFAHLGQIALVLGLAEGDRQVRDGMAS